MAAFEPYVAVPSSLNIYSMILLHLTEIALLRKSSVCDCLRPSVVVVASWTPYSLFSTTTFIKDEIKKITLPTTKSMMPHNRHRSRHAGS